MTSEKIEKTRINNRLPVAREGISFILIGAVITIFSFYFSWLIFGCVMLVMTLFTVYFFRDPERYRDCRTEEILSPADGRIIKIEELEESSNPLNGPVIKISIFMSVFNVHVNRIPINGQIEKISYNPGRFFSANLDKASEQNESNCLSLITENGKRIAFVQIAGLIARRIVCWIGEQDRVKAGQRFGLIRFGSRLDVYLPQGSKVLIGLSDRVSAGETILGNLPE